MANINQSIKLGSGFLLKGAPVDLKVTAATLEERNSYVTANALYKGAIVYVEETDLFYVYTGAVASGEDFSACWKNLLGDVATDNTVVKLTGDQTIDGVKTFAVAPKIGSETVTTAEAVEGIKTELQGNIDKKQNTLSVENTATVALTLEGDKLTAALVAEYDEKGAAAAAQAAAITDAEGKLAAAKSELQGNIDKKQNTLSVEDSATIALTLEGDKLTAALVAEYDEKGAAAAAQAAAIADADGKLAAAKSELQGAIDDKQDPLTFSSGSAAGAVAFTEDPAGTITAKLAASGVTAGVKYNTVTLDASGVVVAAENVAYEAEGAAAAVKKELTEGIIANNTAAASAAQQTANDAKAAAEAAQTAANVAQGTANQGVADAATAQAAAEAAQKTADQGVTDAAAAKSAADEAKAQADKGVEDAAAAKSAADAAQGTANANTEAIAELDKDVQAIKDQVASATNINDAEVGTTTTYSSSKIVSEINAAKQAVKDDLLGGAGEAYDTLKELGAAIDENKDLLEAFEEVAAGHVAFDKAQELDDTKKAQARTNIGAAAQSAVEAAQAQADKGVEDAAGALAAAQAAKTQADKGVADAATAQAKAEEAAGAASTNASAIEGLDGRIEALEQANEQVLDVAHGGTGAATLAANEIVLGNGTSAVKSVANAEGVLVGAVGAAPAFGKVDVTKHISGVVPVANGGTGVAAIEANKLLVGNATGSAVAAVANAKGVLIGSASGAPAFGMVDLTSVVEGVLPLANGGTGHANANSKAVQIGDVKLTTVAGSDVVVPATGTLATLTGAETLENKTITNLNATGNATVTGDVAITGGISTTGNAAVAGNVVGSGTSELVGFIVDGGEY